jgi:CheY-like chemotaxis protein
MKAPGLGLALTKRLAELHGGTVSLESVVNGGSTFRVWLPIADVPQELAAPVAMPAKQQPSSFLVGTHGDVNLAARDTKRILVVEDHAFNQALISDVLELEGYVVELIYDGSRMLEAMGSPYVLARSLPNLILMDIQLPGVDGFEIMRQLKAHPLWKSVPVIAMTAMAMSGDRDRCLAAGADGYISKPLDLDTVITTVRSFIQY